MSSDDRPEDEAVGGSGEPAYAGSGDEPEGFSLFDEEPEPADTDETPVSTTDEAGGGPLDAGSAVGADAPDEAREIQPLGRRRRGLRAATTLGAVIAVGVFLIGWTRVASSDRFCAACHQIEPAARAADRSVHDDLSCLSCHTGPGLTGALRYLPTFAREVVAQFSPLDWTHGVLRPRSCESCHDDIASTPDLASAHSTNATCASCHGDVAHPPFRLAGFARPVEAPEGRGHPRLYVQTHGDDVVSAPDSCAECHETRFCEACHFRETYPHPDDWITAHGPTQQALGIQSCDGCHPQTFCAGCHGTEIPHSVRWLGEHWRDLQDAPVTPCLLCHPKTDCTDCHSEHQVHREQDLFVGSGA